MTKSLQRGCFYCIEGIDGAGKTTLASAVCEVLNNNTVFIDKKHIDSIANNCVQRQLVHIKRALWDYPPALKLDDMGDYHWLMLIASWYSVLEHAHIQHLLDEGKNVIVDGWVYKYIARFSLKDTLPANLVRQIFQHIPAPEKVILLNIDPQVAGERKGILKGSEAGQYDGEKGQLLNGFIAYQTRVQSVLSELALEHNWQEIDTANTSFPKLVDFIAQSFDG